MYRERDLDNGWRLKYIVDLKQKKMIHASASKGQMRVHKDDENTYTAYIHNPFLPLGHYPTARLAMDACEQHVRDPKSAFDSVDDRGPDRDLFA